MERRKRISQLVLENDDEEAGRSNHVPRQRRCRPLWYKRRLRWILPSRQGAFRLILRHPGRFLILLLILTVIQRPSRLRRWPSRASLSICTSIVSLPCTDAMMGGHPIIGGPYGQDVDRQNRLQKLQQTLDQVKNELQDLRLPALPPQRRDPGGNIIFNDINLRTALRAVVRRRRARAHAWELVERNTTKPIYWIAAPNVLLEPPRYESLVMRMTDLEQRDLVQRMSQADRYHAWPRIRQQLAFIACVLGRYGGTVVFDNDSLPYLAGEGNVEVVHSSGRLLAAGSSRGHDLWKCLLQKPPVADTMWQDLSQIQQYLQQMCPDAYRQVDAWINVKPARAEPRQVVKIRPHLADLIHEFRPKQSYDDILWHAGVRPDWHCMRCLKSPLQGTYEQCAEVCPARYHDILCSSSSRDGTFLSMIQMKSRPTRIPRVVHQTWFDEVGMDRYPELARIQNSWKAKGWEYKFYTDEMARRYIRDYFPFVFVEAFDALIHGAFKADYFRYLVLLREGGVYADVDVMLETSLDSFIAPSMTFFAPRDSVLEYADAPFCLWNGLIGAAPGHPILSRVVEHTTTLILARGDVYDMERRICQYINSPKLEVWKIRAEPLLMLTGPCALGMAFNDALDRNPVQPIDHGLIGVDFGDALILVGDKYDMGSFRFSDPERGIVVASTNLETTLGKEPINTGDVSSIRPPKKHYSSSSKDIAVWGSANVYQDNNSSAVLVSLKTEYGETESA